MVDVESPAAVVGQRLRCERKRLGLSQRDLAKIGGKTRQTQLRYEDGTDSPTLAYLHRLAPIGLDVGYVVTGVPSEVLDEEAHAHSLFKDATPELRAAALAVLNSSNGGSWQRG